MTPKIEDYQKAMEKVLTGKRISKKDKMILLNLANTEIRMWEDFKVKLEAK